ncbi:hypothetical protein AAG906_023973 [Vitis piasezkii]
MDGDQARPERRGFGGRPTAEDHRSDQSSLRFHNPEATRQAQQKRIRLPLSSPSHAANGTIPELHKFRTLQSQSQSESHAMISTDGSGMLQEEFVETHYYKELGSIDKQHHTTGTGFIKVERRGVEDGYGLQLQRRENREMMLRGFKSNPATNDWIPSLEEDEVGYVSSKPSRSESC